MKGVGVVQQKLKLSIMPTRTLPTSVWSSWPRTVSGHGVLVDSPSYQ